MATAKKTKKSTKKAVDSAEVKEVTAVKEEVVLTPMEAGVLKRTEEWAAKVGYAGYSSKDKKSDKIKAIEACLEKNDYSGKQESLAKIISVLLGETVTVKSRGFHFERGVVVVPLVNTNGHNYPLEKPVLILDRGNRMGVTQSGMTGNSLPGDMKEVRPATAKEIHEFFQGSIE